MYIYEVLEDDKPQLDFTVHLTEGELQRLELFLRHSCQPEPEMADHCNEMWETIRGRMLDLGVQPLPPDAR
jgi:hypothetical protein